MNDNGWNDVVQNLPYESSGLGQFEKSFVAQSNQQIEALRKIANAAAQSAKDAAAEAEAAKHSQRVSWILTGVSIIIAMVETIVMIVRG